MASGRSSPRNHRSAVTSQRQVKERIREGEHAGAYIIVDLDVFEAWGIHVSPFGAIAKSTSTPDTIRLIHDLSCPVGRCPNELTDTQSLPPITYASITRLAVRIEELKAWFPNARTLILKGDVHGAFRHLRQHAEDVCWMGGLLPDNSVGVIDLSVPFGWTGSPAFYGVFGRAISYLVGQESPATMCPRCVDREPFFSYEWVDDHIMIEVDLLDRCRTAEDALRLAMLAMLGPTSINESKFTRWSPKTKALGLEWDTEAAAVSIPVDKLEKALALVQALQPTERVSRHKMECVLGSLRHVAACLPAARPFYQRLQSLCRCAPRHGSVSLTDATRDDLRWFEHILRHGSLRGIWTRLFGQLPLLDVHFYMDASNFGAAILDPARKVYIVLAFDVSEHVLMASASSPGFDINIREQLCVALASTLLTPVWAAIMSPRWSHIRCWTDNTTAMARTNTRHSSHQFAQNLNRCIGLAEARHRFRISAAHLPGTCNVLADAGSRTNVSTSNAYFTKSVYGWTQVQVPRHFRHVYKDFSINFKPHHWPRAPAPRTTGRGDNGRPGERTEGTRLNSPDSSRSTPRTPSHLPWTAGQEPQGRHQTPPPPCCPRSATLRGITSGVTVTPSTSTRPTSSLCAGCKGCQQPHAESTPSHRPSSATSATISTSASPATVFSGGLRSWVTSFCFDGLNT